MELNFLALIAAFGFLTIGFLVLYVAKRMSVEMGSTAWTVFFAPIFIYLVLSGSLTEFKAPGLEAKFREALKQPASLSLITKVGLDGENAESTNTAANTMFSIGQSVLAINISALESLSDAELRSFRVNAAVSIYQSFLSGSFIGIVVLDNDRRPLAFIESEYFLELLRIPLDRNVMFGEDEKQVLNPDQRDARLRETRAWTFLKNPKFRAEQDGNKAIAQFDISKDEAYSLMIKNNWDALIIVDQSGRYMGVLSKTRLVDSIFSELVGISIDE